MLTNCIYYIVVPDIITSPQPLTVIQPNNAQFNCTANGLPRPTIQWVNNGIPLQSSTNYTITSTNDSSTQVTSSLTILSATPLDTGIYYCIISNNISTVNVSANLTVYGKRDKINYLSVYHFLLQLYQLLHQSMIVIQLMKTHQSCSHV